MRERGGRGRRHGLRRRVSRDGCRNSLRGTSFSLEHGPIAQRLTTPLIGAHQARNTAIALATVKALGPAYLPPAAETSRALAGVFLPGRFQCRGKFILDV